MTAAKKISLCYSPDSDDAFMFWALKQGHIDCGPYQFEHQRADTETLNTLAAGSDATRLPEVCAVSVHQYAYLTEHYLLLPHGGSVGRAYGPVVVSKTPCTPADLRNARIAIPGFRTSAYLVLRLLIGDFEPTVVPISPFKAVFDALDEQALDAALIIHEGRLLYPQWNLHQVLDIGEAWHQKTQLPLPLGGNVIRKDLGEKHIEAISTLLRQSIQWGLDNREQVITELLQAESREDVQLDRAGLDRYLQMYANQDTVDYGPEGRQAITELFKQGHEQGLLKHPVNVEFAP